MVHFRAGTLLRGKSRDTPAATSKTSPRVKIAFPEFIEVSFGIGSRS
jgi:hypothetical protein